MTTGSRRRSALATLLGNSATVTITLGQAFFLIPLCLIHLGTRLYGAWLAASELLVWIQLLDFGIPNLLTQRVGAALGRGDRADAAIWSSTGLAALTCTAGVLTVAGLAAARFVTHWARVSPGDADAFATSFRIGVVASAVLLVSNGVIGLSRGAQQTGAVNAAQVTGTLLGFLCSLVLIARGWGVASLAIGLFVRATAIGLGGIAFLLGQGRAGWLVPPSRDVWGEVTALVPSMAAASLGYVFANNSEIVLVTTLFGPVPAAVYALTRRSLDALRSLLDSIAWAVFGVFAHLVAAKDQFRARAVLADVLWWRVALACLAGAIAVAVNGPFVSRLFGPTSFGGVWLTAAFAAQMVLGGQSLLTNLLLRAAGPMREGSWLLAAEAAVRLVAMAVALRVVGLSGAPWAAAVVSIGAVLINTRQLHGALPARAVDAPHVGLRTAVAPVIVFGCGLLAGVFVMPATWLALIGIALGVGAVGTVMIWWASPVGTEHGVGFLRWMRS